MGLKFRRIFVPGFAMLEDKVAVLEQHVAQYRDVAEKHFKEMASSIDSRTKVQLERDMMRSENERLTGVAIDLDAQVSDRNEHAQQIIDAILSAPSARRMSKTDTEAILSVITGES